MGTFFPLESPQNYEKSAHKEVKKAEKSLKNKKKIKRVTVVTFWSNEAPPYTLTLVQALKVPFCDNKKSGKGFI